MSFSVEQILEHPSLGSMVALHRKLEGTEAAFGELQRPLPARAMAAPRRRPRNRRMTVWSTQKS